jgi:hypothetical protein
VSLAVNGDIVYVLNSQSNSVARFAFTKGHLSYQQTCVLPAAPRPLDPPYPATASSQWPPRSPARSGSAPTAGTWSWRPSRDPS